MKDKYATITKEELVNIIDNVLNELEIEIDNDGDLSFFEIGISKNNINTIRWLLNKRINNYFEKGGDK